jgi:hypothetical protein
LAKRFGGNAARLSRARESAELLVMPLPLRVSETVPGTVIVNALALRFA